jgi:hypothetical protein
MRIIAYSGMIVTAFVGPQHAEEHLARRQHAGHQRGVAQVAQEVGTHEVVLEIRYVQGLGRDPGGLAENLPDRLERGEDREDVGDQEHQRHHGQQQVEDGELDRPAGQRALLAHDVLRARPGPRGTRPAAAQRQRPAGHAEYS